MLIVFSKTKDKCYLPIIQHLYLYDMEFILLVRHDLECIYMYFKRYIFKY